MSRAADLALLGEGERALLDGLYRLRLASTAQLGELFRPEEPEGVAALLAKLAAAGLAARVPEEGEPAGWHLPAWGLQVAEALRGVAPADRRRPGEELLELLFLRERLALNDLWVALERSRRAGRLEEVGWEVPPRNARRFYAFVAEGDVLLTADAAVQVVDGAGRRVRLIFFDRPSWPLARWQAEFKLWAEFAVETGRAEPILLFCADPVRQALLAAQVTERHNAEVVDAAGALASLGVPSG